MGLEYVLKSVAALVVIILLANVLIKQLNQLSRRGSKHLRIVEKLPLSRTSSLYVVEVMGTYYLMSGTEQHNEILKELSQEEVESSEWRKEKRSQS
ncbi:flagellar biosynthetic protein FliO [Jeotgalibaca caeni]|uniref:flagellar biosynthetic protein FliO n=1 Tax=Jeotgalibaca caeni TaxID=3028623 RepID=UPI00237EE334|nr:flagellar biosynthetic protein FliO [Jeotgalibaca caeni]MDE1548272.1 flagellar biosynthetic protein FliO [Jeotgalibaca caeni]